ncbi:unnamed protein product, partial [Nesidiocoris tenuis]
MTFFRQNWSLCTIEPSHGNSRLESRNTLNGHPFPVNSTRRDENFQVSVASVTREVPLGGLRR